MLFEQFLTDKRLVFAVYCMYYYCSDNNITNLAQNNILIVTRQLDLVDLQEGTKNVCISVAPRFLNILINNIITRKLIYTLNFLLHHKNPTCIQGICFRLFLIYP